MLSYGYRVDLHSVEVQIYAPVLDTSVPEHFPEDIAPELRECRIDEEILLFERFGQRAARPRVFVLDLFIVHILGNDGQCGHCLKLLRARLFYLLNRSEEHLPECLPIPYIEPI